MSTVDPRIARRERDQRTQGPRAVLTAVLAVVHVGVWVLAGYGIAQMYDVFRVMSMNQVGAWDSPVDDGPSVLFFVGVFAGAFLGFVLTAVAGRVLGIGAAAILPLSTGVLGVAVGMALFYPEWTPEESYGQKLPFISGEPQPWGTDEWINYYLPIWLPILFAVIAVLLLVPVLVLALRRRAKAVRMAALLERGLRVTGEITEVLPTGISLNDLPYLAVTVSFRDALGTQRWVTKKGTFPTPPRPGEPAAVWFDPADPGTEKNIMVGFGPQAAVTDPNLGGLPA